MDGAAEGGASGSSTAVDPEILARVPLFGGLRKEDLERVAKSFAVANFSEGTTIIDEGDSEGAFYVILDGGALVRRGGKTLAELGPNQFFGELAALGYHQARTAEVVSAGGCSCAVMTKGELQALVDLYPVISERLFALMVERYGPDAPSDSLTR